MKIFNTLTGEKDEFKPIKNKTVNLFVCGPTVYDYSHLGHAKNYIIFDAFVKYLRFKGFKVFYLQNITDLDDKIIARAREKSVTPKDLALAFEKEYLKDMKLLGVNSVSKYARATNYIKEIISQVERLIEKGYAYEIKGDGIYYNIAKFKNYGKLAGRTVLQAEDSVSRVDYSKDKINRGDFCLWKLSAGDEPSWPSPFGQGRPGWHIEDTAITEKFFGPQYDVHGGARDIIFPHHEAEISQMEAISGKSPLVRYWMHVGFLTVDGQKMSKSLGNYITISDFVKRCPVNCLRFFVLKNLWRSPVDYSESVLIEIRAAMDKIEEFLRRLRDPRSVSKNAKSSKEIASLIKNLKTDFFSDLDDDFNTPQAFSRIFDFMKAINLFLDKNLLSKKQSLEINKFFQEINKFLGIIDFKKITAAIPAEIKKLANLREQYRKSKEWNKADQVRNDIEKRGFTIEDTDKGFVIKK